jgi:hypothetical protein
MVGLIIFVIVLSILIAWLWVRGIDHMEENHPDYKGEDFLKWDDEKNHTEGEI